MAGNGSAKRGGSAGLHASATKRQAPGSAEQAGRPIKKKKVGNVNAFSPKQVSYKPTHCMIDFVLRAVVLTKSAI